MTERVLDLSSEPVRLSIRNGLLVVTSAENELSAIPCDEIAAVVASHRQVTYTHAVLASLAKAGALFVACDEKSTPVSMLLPLDAHHVQAERFRRQAALGLTVKKRLWQSIVREKIRAQATLLEALTGSDHGLRPLIELVRSGDPQNVEARAARRYWSRLFSLDKGQPSFQRWNEIDARTHLLNYGYAVLRAATARGICAAGLHPSFGLHHANVHNAFILADDLMEPFRPLVDLTAATLTIGKRSDEIQLNSETKRRLIASVVGRVRADGEQRTVPDVLTRMAQSLAKVVMGQTRDLWLPDWSVLDQEV